MTSSPFLLLDGKAAAAAWKAHIREEAAHGVLVGKHRPHLAAILVGDHPASAAYVAGKIKDCEEVGFKSTLLRFPSDVHKEDLLEAIDALNRRKDVDGFIVQLPLPEHIDEHEVLLAIDPAKDVDGFHPENVGRMARGCPPLYRLPRTEFCSSWNTFKSQRQANMRWWLGGATLWALPSVFCWARTPLPETQPSPWCTAVPRAWKTTCATQTWL